ncbi:uncharacterized protein LOC143213667 [Lasioglossum baleicum]|uniref:uncharacterized protein LOC143213667 n=1 Tax=Lasioglossum baleicum TaxID=434251 RepID=UPI003FCE54DF
MLSEQLTEVLGLNESRSQEPSFILRRAWSSSSVFSDAFSDASTIPPTSIEEHRRLAGHGPSIGLPAGLPEPPQWWDNKKQPAKPQRKATKNKRRATPGQNQRKRCGTTSTPYDQLPREAAPPERPQPRTARTTRFMPTEQPRPQRLPAPKPKQTGAPTSTTSIPYNQLPREAPPPERPQPRTARTTRFMPTEQPRPQRLPAPKPKQTGAPTSTTSNTIPPAATGGSTAGKTTAKDRKDDQIHAHGAATSTKAPRTKAKTNRGTDIDDVNTIQPAATGGTTAGKTTAKDRKDDQVHAHGAATSTKAPRTKAKTNQGTDSETTNANYTG